jgi:glucose/arabinose dehydrogenase
MEFAPDGRLFVCEQGGGLRVIKNGALLATPFVTLSQISTSGERGLLGVAFDPNFASNQWVYVYYTSTAGMNTHNRVARFTAQGDVAQPGSETLILRLENLSSATNHNGGAIHFGTDGKLYVAVGDNANGSNSQTLSNRLGKVLRINPDGTIPGDNPFFNTASGDNRAIWTLGLRNPFTFAVQPGTGRIYINDVGESSWEEVNEGAPGANYGWPNTEGATSNPAYRTPIFTYPRGFDGTSGCAIAGGTFYNPQNVQFPSSYNGVYFFSDYCSGWIRYLNPAAGNSVSAFATGLDYPVDLKVSSDGALYYLARGHGRGDNGVYKIVYTAANAPQITQHPASQTVSIDQPVTFTVSASGQAPLSYQWQRNGSNIPGATSSSYTLNNPTLADNGALFRCVVSNPSGNTTSNSATLTVINNHLPSPTINSPAVGTLYSGGQSISYSGVATDQEDGNLPASAYTWKVDFHHDTHSHPFVAPTSGATGGTFVIPTSGETSANVWYRIHLTARDSAGYTRTVFRDILPRKVTLTLATSPVGLQLTLDSQPVATPNSFESVVGIVRSIGAPSPQGSATFASWSDSAAQTHNISTPAVNTTYTATFSVPPPPTPGSVVFKEDFEVRSEYSYVAPGTNVLIPEGLYTIDTNPNRSHNAFASFGDHTTGSGRMLIANGRSVTNSVWARTISGLTAGQQYRLRLFGASAHPQAPATLQFRVNSTAMAPTLTLPTTTGAWMELAVQFTASASQVSIDLVDLTTAPGGNDFVIDDIEVTQLSNSATILKEDFEVRSDYTYVGPGPNVLFPEGNYTIDTNPQTSHSSFSAFGDHTNGTGRMLIANGRATVNSVWARRVSGLVSGQQYRLRLFAATAFPLGPANLQFRVNNVALSPTLTLPLTPGAWTELSVQFTASSASADLDLVDLSTVAAGNDFAIDDIELYSLSGTPPPPTTPGTFKEDFEVSSDYQYVHPATNALLPEGTYTIATNPRSVHNSFCTFGDHTTGSGRMLIANGRNVVNSVWSRTVSGLTAGRQYRISLWAASAFPQGAAQLQFIVAGAPLSPVLTAPLYGGACPAPGSTIWQKLESTFTASATQATISLVDQSTVAAGNDFTVDDIELIDTTSSTVTFKEDFEVSSDYQYVHPATNALLPEGTYTIAANPRSVHNSFCTFGDHTTGAGRMLIANGRNVVNSVWSRTISGLTVGRQYRISLYAASAFPQGAAQLQFIVAGTPLSPVLTAPLYGGACPAAGTPSTTIWQKLESTFTAGSTQVTVNLVDQSTVAAGNDFAVDDIELIPQ